MSVINTKTHLGGEMHFQDANKNFLPHKSRTTNVIDHDITTRRAGVELLKRIDVVQLREPPHVRLVRV